MVPGIEFPPVLKITVSASRPLSAPSTMSEDHVPLPFPPNSDFLGQNSGLHTVAPQQCVTASFANLGLPLGNSVLRTFLPFDRENGSKTPVLRSSAFCQRQEDSTNHKQQVPFLPYKAPRRPLSCVTFTFPEDLVRSLPSPSSVVALPCPAWLHFPPQSEKRLSQEASSALPFGDCT